MAHSNRDIAQESAEEFLSKDIWDLVEETYDKHGWNEMYIVKVSKRDAVRRIVRTHLSVFEAKPGIADLLSKKIGVMGSFCLYVKRRPKEIKHVWNLPYERRGNIVIPDGRTSSLILDSVNRLGNGKDKLNPEVYASLGFSV